MRSSRSTTASRTRTRSRPRTSTRRRSRRSAGKTSSSACRRTSPASSSTTTATCSGATACPSRGPAGRGTTSFDGLVADARRQRPARAGRRAEAGRQAGGGVRSRRRAGPDQARAVRVVERRGTRRRRRAADAASRSTRPRRRGAPVLPRPADGARCRPDRRGGARPRTTRRASPTGAWRCCSQSRRVDADLPHDQGLRLGRRAVAGVRTPAGILHSDAYCMTRGARAQGRGLALHRVRARPQGQRDPRADRAHGALAEVGRRLGRLPRPGPEAEELPGVPRRDPDDPPRADDLDVAGDRGRRRGRSSRTALPGRRLWTRSSASSTRRRGRSSRAPIALSGLRLDGVVKHYGDVPALHGIDLDVGDGELLVVLGPSGWGKSTLLRVVAGLEAADGGPRADRGRDVTNVPPGRRNVSMVFQTYALFPHLTSRRTSPSAWPSARSRSGDAQSGSRAAAELVGCADLLAAGPPSSPAASGSGSRSRRARARADVFLLDEPLSNLDAELRAQMRAELKALHARVGGTMVHVTHDQAEALVLGDRVAVLRAGVLEQVGRPTSSGARPRTRSWPASSARRHEPRVGRTGRSSLAGLPDAGPLGSGPARARAPGGGRRPRRGRCSSRWSARRRSSMSSSAASGWSFASRPTEAGGRAAGGIAVEPRATAPLRRGHGEAGARGRRTRGASWR